MVLMAIVLFGVIAFQKIGIDLFPKVDFPVVTVLSTLPGSDPETIETAVTEPIEDALSSISSIKHLRSISAEGISHVIIEFELEKDVDVAYQEVQAKIGSIRNLLPRDLEGLQIEKFDIDSIPILSLLISGEVPIQELTQIVDKDIKNSLQRVPQIGQIKLVGGRKSKVWFFVDRDRLNAYALSLQDVEQSLQTQHIELPGGRVELPSSEILLKTKGEFPNVSEFENLVIASRNGELVHLKDIGRVEDGLEEERGFAKLNGKSAIALLVSRQSGANSVEIATKVKEQVKDLNSKLSSRGIHLEVAQDNSVYIKHSVDEVRFHLFFGGILAVLIVLLFLRNIRSTFICALALPASVVGTFAFMSAMGFTQNNMTLLALSIAIGLLIDDAIVVQENIIRHAEDGKTPSAAASFGTKEIALAVLATTLSVVAVFVPVAFMQGIVGRFFYQFGLTVSFAVLISMFVSFTLNPMMSAKLLKHVHKGKTYLYLENYFIRLERGYARVLGFCLRHRGKVVLIALGSFVGAIALGKFLQFEFVPQEDRNEFNVNIKAPQDASLSYTKGVLEKVEARVKDHPWVDYLFSTIGSDGLHSVNQGSIYVKMADKSKRSISQQDAMMQMRKELADITEGQVTIEPVEMMSGGGKVSDLQFEIRGPLLSELKSISDQIIQKMKAAGGYFDISTSLETGKTQANILIKRDAAADLGITPLQIASTIKAAFGGVNIATYKEAGDRYDIGLRFMDTHRDDISKLDHIQVKNYLGELIPLKHLIEIEEKAGPTQIDRYNRTRQVTVYVNLARNEKVLGDAMKEIDRFVAEAKLPAGYNFDYTGAASDFKESFGHLVFALFLAVILVYMVLAAQFESFSNPFIIMLSLPLSIIGAIGALVAFNMTMSIFTMIGVIMLMGLVTKNGILLVDFMNTLYLKEKVSLKEAILKAGSLRLRPILMTTFAVILGMLPVALGTGAGSESRAPMAVAVIGGLITSTILTLLVIPVVYSLLAQWKAKKRFSLQKALSLLIRKKKVIEDKEEIQAP